MSTISKTILSQHTYLGSGAEEYGTGQKVPGDGFYGRSDGIHTVQYAVTDFRGTIRIEATLSSDPAEEDWFPVYSQYYPTANETSSTSTTSNITNFTGNYVWIRASIAYYEGTVNKILLSH